MRYKGEYYEGRHDALIDVQLFDRVQELLDTRGYASERRRKHDHYLKGTIWCGRCRLEADTNRRMILMHATSKSKATYSYFFCRGAQDHTCDAPYSNIDRVEEAVERHYKTISLRPEFATAVRTLMEAAVNDQIGAQKMLQEQTKAQLTRLATQEDNLIDLAADGGIDTSRVRSKLRDIARQRKELEAELESITDDIRPGMAYIDAHLDLLHDPYELYRYASDQTRRMLNQAIFKHIYVVNEEVVGDELNTPMRELLASQRGWTAFEAAEDIVYARNLAISRSRKPSATKPSQQKSRPPFPMACLMISCRRCSPRVRKPLEFAVRHLWCARRDSNP
ncbi:MAG: zinc ribbon domain-containing protein [Microbacterium sp.]